MGAYSIHCSELRIDYKQSNLLTLEASISPTRSPLAVQQRVGHDPQWQHAQQQERHVLERRPNWLERHYPFR
jgi:hypothetical protein